MKNHWLIVNTPAEKDKDVEKVLRCSWAVKSTGGSSGGPWPSQVPTQKLSTVTPVSEYLIPLLGPECTECMQSIDTNTDKMPTPTRIK